MYRVCLERVDEVREVQGWCLCFVEIVVGEAGEEDFALEGVLSCRVAREVVAFGEDSDIVRSIWCLYLLYEMLFHTLDIQDVENLKCL